MLYVQQDASVLTRVQAAAAIDTLKMTESPAKKLNFSSADKENVYKPIVGIPDLDELEEVTDKKPVTAATIKPEEAYEPLLQENPQRFVLFPIKYHDVSHLYIADALPDAPYSDFKNID